MKFVVSLSKCRKWKSKPNIQQHPKLYKCIVFVFRQQKITKNKKPLYNAHQWIHTTIGRVVVVVVVVVTTFWIRQQKHIQTYLQFVFHFSYCFAKLLSLTHHGIGVKNVGFPPPPSRGVVVCVCECVCSHNFTKFAAQISKACKQYK